MCNLAKTNIMASDHSNRLHHICADAMWSLLIESNAHIMIHIHMHMHTLMHTLSKETTESETEEMIFIAFLANNRIIFWFKSMNIPLSKWFDECATSLVVNNATKGSRKQERNGAIAMGWETAAAAAAWKEWETMLANSKITFVQCNSCTTHT